VVGNAHARHRGAGHAVVLRTPHAPRPSAGSYALGAWGRGGSTTVQVWGVWQREPEASQGTGRAVSGTWRAEPRPAPDSGQPTVRDRRGACSNVHHGGTRHPLHNRKGADRQLSTSRCARCISIPTSACYVLWGRALGNHAFYPAALGNRRPYRGGLGRLFLM
jgi:hypothetical protein